MKKLYVIALVIWAGHTNAQKNVNREWAASINEVFEHLNIRHAPGGVLLDYAMEFTDVGLYNGTITDTTRVDATVFSNIYKTLLMGKTTTDTTYFPRFETYAERWRENRKEFNATEQNTIVLGGLFYKYGQMDSTMTGREAIIHNGKQYFDKFVDGVWQNPFIEKYTMAIAPPVTKYNKLQFNVVLPQELFLGNMAAEVMDIEVDFEDGKGY